MKIVSFHAENFMKLRAVQITPEGSVVQITGANGEGKSSILNAIWAALGGKEHVPAQPIRRGEKSAKIRLDLGEIIVTRRFSEGGGTTLVVEAQNGARFPSPQRMLDDLIGSISFDPLAFTRMEPRAQFDMLRRLVNLDLDLDSLAKADREDFDNRTESTRAAKAFRAQADAIIVPEGLPDERIDTPALMDRMTNAAQNNAEIERRKAARATAADKVVQDRASAADTDADLERTISSISAAITGEVAATEEEISDLQARLAKARQKIDRVRREGGERAAEAERSASARKGALETAANELQAKLDAAPPLPAPVDVEALRAEIDAANQMNAGIDQRIKRVDVDGRAAEKETESKRLTDAITERDRLRRAAVEQAKMPINGLSLGDGHILFNGIPLAQASHAERLRVSVGIAMAANPKLRVLRVESGESMDAKSLAILHEMIDGADFQCWLEVVSDGDRPGILIEDGAIKDGAAQ